MPDYKYKYIVNGVEKEETKFFADKKELYSTVRSENGSIISVEDAKGKSSSFNLFSFGKGIKLEEQINFAKNTAVMVDAGLPISRALAVLQKQSRSKNFKNLIESILVSISSGETFSKALELHQDIFSPLFISMVRAGEESGDMTKSLRLVADQMEKNSALIKKVKGAVIYPIIIVIIMIIITILLMVFMVPTLSATFQGLNVALPLPTRILIAMSDLVRNHIILLIVGSLSFISLASYLLRTKKGKRFGDFVTLRIPIISLMAKELNAARTARTLSSLISSGVNMLVALKVVGDVLQNSYYKEVLKEAEVSIQKGENLSVIFQKRENLYPVFVSEMVSVGEETGHLSDMLENIATYYESEIDQKTKNLSTVIEPFLMVFIGLGVGVFAIAMLAPTYALVDVIGTN